MKAVVCNQYGPPENLDIEEWPSPQAGAGQVVISVRAAGINYPDALLVQGKHQYRPDPPFCFGGELAGVVKETGPGVTEFSVGDRVYGSRLRGAFAEEVAIHVDKIMPMPENLSFEQAAGLSTTYNTSYYALVILANLQPGESVLVLGAAGGVGLAAIEIAKALGARVIAAASSPEKLEICAACGADELVDYCHNNLRERMKEITGKSGVDVVYDPVGGDYAELAMRSLGWRGRYLVVGFASGDIPSLPLNLVLLKGAAVIGVFLGETWSREPETVRAIDEGMTRLVKSGKIRPRITGVYPFEKIADALYALLERRVTGKLVLVPQVKE